MTAAAILPPKRPHNRKKTSKPKQPPRVQLDPCAKGAATQRARPVTLPPEPFAIEADTERRDTAPSPRMIRIDPEEQEA
jgi:hypothetical protein